MVMDLIIVVGHVQVDLQNHEMCVQVQKLVVYRMDDEHNTLMGLVGEHVLQIVVIQISIKYEMYVMQYEQDIIQQIIH